MPIASRERTRLDRIPKTGSGVLSGGSPRTPARTGEVREQTGSTAPSAAAARALRPSPDSTAGTRAASERALGRGLLAVRDTEAFRRLGYVRMGDYVLERLGLSQRTSQELVRVEEALAGLPLTAGAYEDGSITAGHVRLLARVASGIDEEMWVARARRSSVRGLVRVVKLALREREGMGGGDGAARAADGAHAGSNLDAGTREAASIIDPEAASVERVVRAPAWIRSMWREAKVVVRRIAGGLIPDGACLEAVLAECQGGGWQPPGASEDDLHASAPADAGDGREVTGTDRPVASLHTSAPLATEAGMVGHASHQDESSDLHGSARNEASDSPRSVAGIEIDPHGLDRQLRDLVTERQQNEVDLADHLASCRELKSFRAGGFESLEAYALERLGLSPRRTYYLLALHRDMDRLWSLRRGYLSGRLTLRKALLVAKVAVPGTVDAWIRRAEGVTLRRLEDEIDFWLHLRETRYQVWRLMNGRPLPEGIVLVPGHEPRLHASARPEAGRERPPGGAEATVGASERNLHTFAPVDDLTAAALLEALEADEGLIPLPSRMTGIEIRMGPAVSRLFDEKVAALRASIRPDLQEWEVLGLAIRQFLEVWDNKETRRQARENPVVVRDGWRCMAPGCRSFGSGKLHVHHIEHRSAGGPDAGWNLVTLCSGHHLGLLHRGFIRVRGRAPDELIWEMGVDPEHPERGAFQVHAGDALLAGRGSAR